MSKRTYEELRDMLRHELDVLTKKGEITKESLDHFQKLTATLWKIEELLKAEQGDSEGGYSQRGEYSNRYMMPMGSYDGQSMNYGANPNDYSRTQGGMSNTGSYNDRSYNGGSSYARQGRDGDGDGRYSENSNDYSRRRYSYGRYSRHTEKEKMIEKLERMADSASSEKERRAIMECIDELEGQ